MKRLVPPDRTGEGVGEGNGKGVGVGEGDGVGVGVGLGNGVGVGEGDEVGWAIAPLILPLAHPDRQIKTMQLKTDQETRNNHVLLMGQFLTENFIARFHGSLVFGCPELLPGRMRNFRQDI
jgi:hypothetical protein